MIYCGELADLMPNADSHVSSKQAAEQLDVANAVDPIKKDLGVNVTPP